MRYKQSGQRSCAPAVRILPGNPHPQLPAIGTLFGQHAVAFVDDKAVYSPVIPIPVRVKRSF